MKKQYLLIASGVIILLGFFGFYFYKFPGNQKSSSDEIQKKYVETLNSFYTNSADKTITELNDVLSKSPSKDIEASSKIALAFAYQSKSRSKSVLILKEVAANTNYSNEMRARALGGMADMFMLGSRASTTLRQDIFSGSYKDYSKETNIISGDTGYLSGIIRMYIEADNMSPLPVAEFRIAEWYAKDKNISETRKYIEKGNKTLSALEGVAGRILTKIYSLWVKGSALSALSKLENKNSDKVAAEAAFKESLQMINSNNLGLYGVDHALWASFSYASFLAGAYGKARADDIKILTAYIVDSNRLKDKGYFGVYRYLSNLGTLKSLTKKEQYDYDNALALAKLDFNFAKYLKDLGWEIK